jgi:MoxR-like ATPase
MKNIWKEFEEYQLKIEQQKEEIAKRIMGLPKLIEAIFICFYSHSERKICPHLLVEGKVGQGKTVTLDTFTKTISGASFKRIQFTPDLKPMDLIRIVEQHEDRTLDFQTGPLFSNLVLADEINRAHEKTRAALLEAMGEMQITIGKTTYKLEEPFFVMATQNPVDVEGTFALGAAQLDRFMMKIYTESLSEDEEVMIVESHQQKDPQIREVVTREDVLKIREFIRQNIIVPSELRRDIIRIIRNLRPEGGVINTNNYYNLPEGQRGALYLERGAKTRAFLKGRNQIIFSDVAVLVNPILRHRICEKYTQKKIDSNYDVEEIICKSVKKVVENGAKGL